jgi:hypothetical protein
MLDKIANFTNKHETASLALCADPPNARHHARKRTPRSLNYSGDSHPRFRSHTPCFSPCACAITTSGGTGLRWSLVIGRSSFIDPPLSRKNPVVFSPCACSTTQPDASSDPFLSQTPPIHQINPTKPPATSFPRTAPDLGPPASNLRSAKRFPAHPHMPTANPALDRRSPPPL